MYRDEMISEISMRCDIPVEDVAEVLEEEENIIEEEKYFKKRKKKMAFACCMATAVATACAAVYILNKKNKIDIEKAKTELGYAPMSVKQSITDMVAWIRENEKQ